MNYQELQSYMRKKRKEWLRAALSHLSCLIRIGASDEAIQLAVWQAQSYAQGARGK
jgi:hypothetical protein